MGAGGGVGGQVAQVEVRDELLHLQVEVEVQVQVQVQVEVQVGVEV